MSSDICLIEDHLPVEAISVKAHERQKEHVSDASWPDTLLVLRPDTTAAGYEPINQTPEAAADLRIIAELVAVLG